MTKLDLRCKRLHDILTDEEHAPYPATLVHTELVLIARAALEERGISVTIPEFRVEYEDRAGPILHDRPITNEKPIRPTKLKFIDK